jgi:hypothetical protein
MLQTIDLQIHSVLSLHDLCVHILCTGQLHVAYKSSLSCLEQNHLAGQAHFGVHSSRNIKNSSKQVYHCRHARMSMAYMPHLHKNGNPGAGSSHGIPPGSAAKLWPRCDGIPTESVHKLSSAVAMVSPRHLQAAAAMASPRQLQHNSGLGQLQLRWHPHRICTQAEVCSCDGIPTASA